MTTWPRTLSEAERSAILDDQVERFAWTGWVLTSRTATTAQMVRPKRFSAGCALLGLLFLLVGLIAYLLLYLGQQDEMVWLTIREEGQVNGRWRHGGTKWPVLPGDWTCAACAYVNRAERSTCRRCRAPR